MTGPMLARVAPSDKHGRPRWRLAAPNGRAIRSRTMSEPRGAFQNVVKQREAPPPMPVDEYLTDLDRLIEAHNAFRQDAVIPAIGRGTASREVVQRLALEFYYLG